MELFDKLGDTIVSVSKDATQKAKNISELARIRMEIRSKQDYLNKLFLEIGKKEVAQAMRLRAAFEKKGWPLFVNSASNQQFPVLPNKAMAALEAQYSFEVWEAVDESHTAVRFCTSWSTTDRDVDALIADIQVL